MVNVFTGDAFTTAQMVAAINKMPYRPTRIGDLKLFRSSGLVSDTAVIEEKDGQLSLIQTSPRGGPPAQLVGAQRKARPFIAAHIEQEARVTADSVRGVRDFGTENNLQTVEAVVRDRQGVLKNNIDATLEWHRIGAIKGQVLDADATTVLWNLFDEFDVVQQTANISKTEAETRKSVIAAQRKSEDELGAEFVTGYRAFCGDAFFDAFVETPAIRNALLSQQGDRLLTDWRQGFSAFGVVWENYRGNVGGQAFIGTNDAYLVPEGTSIFQQYFAPGDFIGEVNEIGLPYYSKLAVDPKYQRWADVLVQSNPLTLCLRPRAVIKLALVANL